MIHSALAGTNQTTADALRAFRTRGYGVRHTVIKGFGVCGADVTLPNGWQLSILCCPGSYSSHYLHAMTMRHSSYWFAATMMEVAIKRPNGCVDNPRHVYEFLTPQAVIDLADQVQWKRPRGAGERVRAAMQALFG